MQQPVAPFPTTHQSKTRCQSRRIYNSMRNNSRYQVRQRTLSHNRKRLSSRVNQGKIVSRPYGRKVLQQQSAILTSGNGIQCTSRAVHSWDDHGYSQAAQSCYLAYPHIQCLSSQTSQSGRTLTHMQRRIFRCKPCLHKLRCRTVSTTYRSIKLAREIQSSCHQTSQDQSLAVFWQEPGALRHSVHRSKACSMHGTGSALSQA